MEQSPLGPSFSAPPGGHALAIGAEQPNTWSKNWGLDKVKNGFQIAREIADWMAGQERKAAIKYIDRMEELYNASRATEAPGENQTLPVSSGNRGLEESAEGG